LSGSQAIRAAEATTEATDAERDPIPEAAVNVRRTSRDDRRVIDVKPSTSPNDTICRKCSHATVVEGHTQSTCVIFCNILQERIKFNVAKCNSFFDSNDRGLSLMMDLAWVIVTDTRKTVGFKSPAEFRKLEREEGY
jgi:hypothetical protein